MINGLGGKSRTRAATKAGRRFWLFLLAPILIGGAFLVGAALATQGRVDPPIDDSLIFFQFAKNTARGYVMTFQVGEGPTAGCTSLLWMLYLTVGWGVGWRGVLLGWFSAASGIALLVISVALIYRLLRTFEASSSVAGLTGVLLASTGPVVYAYLSGAETGLFTTLILATVFFGARKELVRFAVSAALLTWARPEGIVVALILVAWYFCLSGKPSARYAWLLVVPAAVIAEGTFFYFSTGELSTNSYYAKSPLAAFAGSPRPPDFYKIKLWLEPLLALKAITGSAFGYVPRYALRIDAASAAYKASVFITAYILRPIILGGFIAGLGAAAFRARRLAIPVFLAAAAVLTANAVALGDFHFFWHRCRYGAPLLALAIVGVGYGLAYAARVFRLGPWPAAALVLVTLPTTWCWGACFANDSRFVYCFYEPVVKFIKGELGPEAVIATHDAGYVSYYTDNRIVDIGGLCARRYAEALRAGDGAIVEALERERPLPTLFFIYPYRVQGVEATVAGPCLKFYCNESFQSYTCKAYFPADFSDCGADRPRRVVGGKEVVDTLDVADLDSESAHNYRCGAFVCFDCMWVVVREDGTEEAYEQRCARSGVTYALRAKYRGGREAVDGGRVIAESEEFTVATSPGRAATLLMRTDRPIRRPVAVYVNDVFAGLWLPQGPRAGVWREVRFDIPSRLVEGNDTIRLMSEPFVHEINYTPFHYWVFQ